MNAVDIIVILAAMGALAGLGWFFFGPRKATAAVLAGGVQRLEVTVKGGYSPEVIRVRQGVPVELTFDRQESGDCTSRVVFSDIQMSAALPAWRRTTVRLDPGKAGEFGFACGMNMIRGTLIVEPAADGGFSRQDQAAAATEPTTLPEVGGMEAERAGELADLARRVLAGVALTLPVLYAAMAHDVFGAWPPPESAPRKRLWPSCPRQARPRCWPPSTASWPELSPWPTPSRRIRPPRSRPCAAWARTWSC
jgi:Cu+-exporting ATPase